MNGSPVNRPKKKKPLMIKRLFHNLNWQSLVAAGSDGLLRMKLLPVILYESFCLP
jgi:hypothetical protein